MAAAPCLQCGGPVVQPRSSGRPRKFCGECRPSRAGGYRPVARLVKVCVCGAEFEGTSKRRFCSEVCGRRERDRLRKRVPCCECGRLVWLGSSSAAVPKCRSCRAPKHGDVAMYQKRGCRCAECRAAVAAYNREYAARRRAEGRPVPRGGSWLSRSDRAYIYMRDDFTCQLCGVRVNLDVHYMDDAAPTVDHIVPRALGGSNEFENLRLACRKCNSSRGARVDWRPDGVAAGDAAVAG